MVEVVGRPLGGTIEGLYIIGGPDGGDSDLTHVEASLKNLEFLVVQPMSFRDPAQLADIRPSCMSSPEKDGTFTNTEERSTRSGRRSSPSASSDPVGKCSQPWLRQIGSPMPYDSAEQIFEIHALAPSYAVVTLTRSTRRTSNGPVRTLKHRARAIFIGTASPAGKGRLPCHGGTLPLPEFRDNDYSLDVPGPAAFLYQSPATATMTGRCEGLQFLQPKGCVEIHERDASAIGVKDREVVRVSSRRGSIEITAQVTDRSLPGTVFIPFHFFEAAANRLTHSELDPIGKTPEFKVCAVKVEPLSASAGVSEAAATAAP